MRCLVLAASLVLGLSLGLAPPVLAQDNLYALWNTSAGACYEKTRPVQDRLDHCNKAIKLSNDRASGASDADLLKLLMYRSSAYLEVKDYPSAIADADLAQKLSNYSTQALNMQCWSRAVANVELDKARAACTEAIRIDKDDPNPFDSRGLVNLREGKWADAFNDYKVAAVFLTMPFSRYGAGLAVIAYGDVPRGETLVATALERDAKAGDELNALGFTPDKMKAIAAAKAKPN